MENQVKSPLAGTVGEVLVSVGESLAAGSVLTSVTVEEDA